VQPSSIFITGISHALDPNNLFMALILACETGHQSVWEMYYTIILPTFIHNRVNNLMKIFLLPFLMVFFIANPVFAAEATDQSEITDEQENGKSATGKAMKELKKAEREVRDAERAVKEAERELKKAKRKLKAAERKAAKSENAKKGKKDKKKKNDDDDDGDGDGDGDGDDDDDDDDSSKKEKSKKKKNKN